MSYTFSLENSKLVLERGDESNGSGQDWEIYFRASQRKETALRTVGRKTRSVSKKCFTVGDWKNKLDISLLQVLSFELGVTVSEILSCVGNHASKIIKFIGLIESRLCL